MDCLTNFESYAESIWHTANYSGSPADSGYWGDGGSSGNGGIRGNSGVAVAYAVLAIAQPDDPRTTIRLSRIRQALNYDVATHVTGNRNCVDGHQWGWSSSNSGDWQTPEWSGSMGLACILVQSNLPDSTVEGVRRVVASEASHRASIPPASGYISDTKAEENAWQGNILALAAAWLSESNNAPLWLNAAKSYLANTYTVADTNGDPLASWISTVTLYPSYALQNHGFYHPTYEMVAGMSSGDSLLMARLANPDVAAELQPFAEHNVMAVWTNNMNTMVMDSGDFAYPAGIDWELHDYEQNSYITWMATHFNDPLARWTDEKLSQLVRARQLVNGDGSFIGPSGGGFYREAVEARRTAIAWLHLAHADFPTGPVAAPAPVVAQFPDVNIIVQRSSNGFVSLSYGSRVMAMIEAPTRSGMTNDFVATPLLPGVIGMGALGNPGSAQLISFSTNASGFDAQLQIQNGARGNTDVYMKSAGESVGILEVPHPAEGATLTGSGSFSMGIENDPLTGGSRLLEWNSGSDVIENRSGTSRHITNNWICVSGHYGVAAGPAGYFNYRAASDYNRLGAAQDTLQFYPANPIGPRYAVWFPGKNAEETSSKTAQISWHISGTNAVLKFPGANGAMEQISASVPAMPVYPPYSVPVAAVNASSSQPGYPPTNAADGNLNNFWVSAGTNPGEGPTTNKPEWLQFTFSRPTGISGFQIAPRTFNGGYGPKNIEMLFNGVSIFTGTMAPNLTLDIPLARPVQTTNAELMIYSSYDPNYPDDSRNVQVMEVTFFERAQPGTFADWQLQHFTDAELDDSSIGSSQADPDNDGLPNLLEFAEGGDPLTADATNASASVFFCPAIRWRFSFANVIHSAM
ncbi:MAG TPA: discoidin domain-containing protein [Verrucomicrobiae bacterium]|nr:discoidin domain-containing protein [Verrucomicrobiae bacterium]